MKYKILKTTRGSQTGAITETFEKDTVCTLSDDLAKVALADKWAEPFTEKPAKKDKKDKAED